VNTTGVDRDGARLGTRVPAWSSFVLSLIGLGISGYLAYEYLTGSETLVCSDSGAINCLKVTTSEWAVIAGVPVSVAGFGFFAAMTLLCAPVAAVGSMHLMRMLLSAIGILMVGWLIFVEIAKVHAICLWCTGVHAVTLLLLVSVVWWWRTDRPNPR
jgi:uncharacterized membrane protein